MTFEEYIATIETGLRKGHATEHTYRNSFMNKAAYQHVVDALKKTIRLMKEIDKIISKWPIETIQEII